jgi:hypothetical protein
MSMNNMNAFLLHTSFNGSLSLYGNNKQECSKWRSTGTAQSSKMPLTNNSLQTKKMVKKNNFTTVKHNVAFVTKYIGMESTLNQLAMIIIPIKSAFKIKII